MRAARALCDRYEVPLFIDAARFAENCWFVIQREVGYADRTPTEVARELFSLPTGSP